MVEVSVVIPCYNCDATLKRAVESVFNQTFRDWELILVNNNSSDGTGVLLEEYQKTNPDKIRIYNELKKGANAARNKGLKEANGRWVQFLDADDELYNTKIESQLQIAKRKDCDIVCGSYITIQKMSGSKKRLRQLSKIFNSNVSLAGDWFKEIRKVNSTDIVWVALIRAELGITTSILWKKDELTKVSGWDENLSSSQEYDLLFRLLCSGNKLGFEIEPCALVHKSDNSVSASTDSIRLRRIMSNSLNLRNRIRCYCEGKGILDSGLRLVLDKWIYLYLWKYKAMLDLNITKMSRDMSLKVPFSLKLRCYAIYIFKKIVRWSMAHK